MEKQPKLLKRIALFLSVTSFRFAKDLPSYRTDVPDAQNKSFGYAFVLVFYFGGIAYFSDHIYPISFNNLKVLIGLILVYHIIIDIIYNKDIATMAGNYFSYYNKTLLDFYFHSSGSTNIYRVLV